MAASQARKRETVDYVMKLSKTFCREYVVKFGLLFC